MIQECARQQSTKLSDLLQRATPGQRLRMRKLLNEYAALKYAVLNGPAAIEQIEPCLAAPRSSLSPEHFAQCALGDEIRDSELTKQAKREMYRASEEKQ